MFMESMNIGMFGIIVNVFKIFIKRIKSIARFICPYGIYCLLTKKSFKRNKLILLFRRSFVRKTADEAGECFYIPSPTAEMILKTLGCNDQVAYYQQVGSIEPFSEKFLKTIEDSILQGLYDDKINSELLDEIDKYSRNHLGDYNKWDNRSPMIYSV